MIDDDWAPLIRAEADPSLYCVCVTSQGRRVLRFTTDEIALAYRCCTTLASEDPVLYGRCPEGWRQIFPVFPRPSFN